MDFRPEPNLFTCYKKMFSVIYSLWLRVCLCPSHSLFFSLFFFFYRCRLRIARSKLQRRRRWKERDNERNYKERDGQTKTRLVVIAIKAAVAVPWLLIGTFSTLVFLLCINFCFLFIVTLLHIMYTSIIVIKNIYLGASYVFNSYTIYQCDHHKYLS